MGDQSFLGIFLPLRHATRLRRLLAAPRLPHNRALRWQMQHGPQVDSRSASLFPKSHRMPEVVRHGGTACGSLLSYFSSTIALTGLLVLLSARTANGLSLISFFPSSFIVIVAIDFATRRGRRSGDVLPPDAPSTSYDTARAYGQSLTCFTTLGNK